MTEEDMLKEKKRVSKATEALCETFNRREKSFARD